MTETSAAAHPPETLGVLILAAGASARMGRPKLLLPWNGTTVIGQLISQWQQLGAKQIALVCRPNDAGLNAELGRLGFAADQRMENPQPEHGMFSSILCAARWAGWRPELTTWAIVLGDQPHLRHDTLTALLKFHDGHAAGISQPVHDGHGSHPVLLRRPAWAQLRETSAVTLDAFLKSNLDAVRQCPLADTGLSLDLDTPEDYKQATLLTRAHEKL